MYFYLLMSLVMQKLLYIMTLLEVLKIISRYWPKNYLDYHKVIIFIYNYSKIIVYYTFSDKSTFIEMCNNDG